jgi:hypothetical protein
MKKAVLVFLVLIFALTALALSGCGSDDNDDSENGNTDKNLNGTWVRKSVVIGRIGNMIDEEEMKEGIDLFTYYYGDCELVLNNGYYEENTVPKDEKITKDDEDEYFYGTKGNYTTDNGIMTLKQIHKYSGKNKNWLPHTYGNGEVVEFLKYTVNGNTLSLIDEEFPLEAEREKIYTKVK